MKKRKQGIWRPYLGNSPIRPDCRPFGVKWDRFWRRPSWKSAGSPLSSRQETRLLLFLICLLACSQRVSVVPTSTSCRRDALAPDGHRRAIAERLMKATFVVEGEMFAEAGFRLAAVGVAP